MAIVTLMRGGRMREKEREREIERERERETQCRIAQMSDQSLSRMLE